MQGLCSGVPRVKFGRILEDYCVTTHASGTRQDLDWKNIIPPEERAIYEEAGFGRRGGIGRRPALLVIDVQYRTVGTTPRPIREAMREFPTACGEFGWAAVPQIAALQALFRARGWPVLFPHVAPKQDVDRGVLAQKVPSMWDVPPKGYEFVAEAAPLAGELLLPKKHPSAFYGTPLTSHLVDFGVDTLVLTGCTTSGCVRASAVDAFSTNFRVLVPSDAVYDRGQTSHAVNLFDMAEKYADVMTTAECLDALAALPA